MQQLRTRTDHARHRIRCNAEAGEVEPRRTVWKNRWEHCRILIKPVTRLYRVIEIEVDDCGIRYRICFSKIKD